MKVLTYTSHKEHCDLYTEIYSSIALNSCQTELAQKDIILISKLFIMIYKAGKRTGVENTKFINSNLSVGTYSTDDFNAKIKVAISQQRQDWEPPQIKESRLVIPEDYTFTASNNIFNTLGKQDNYLVKTTLIRSRLPPGSYKLSLHRSPPPIFLSLHCKQISKVKTKLDGQPSSLLASKHVYNNKTNFSPIHLVFLELYIHHSHLDFKMLDENNNEVIPRTLHLQLLNKE